MTGREGLLQRGRVASLCLYLHKTQNASNSGLSLPLLTSPVSSPTEDSFEVFPSPLKTPFSGSPLAVSRDLLEGLAIPGIHSSCVTVLWNCSCVFEIRTEFDGIK